MEPLAVPEATFKDKLRRSIPHGAGPDLFIRPHNEIGELADAGVLGALTDSDLPSPRDSYLSGLIDGDSANGRLVGIPLTYKGLVQFYNTALLPDGPFHADTELVAARARLPTNQYPLAYDCLLYTSPSPRD